MSRSNHNYFEVLIIWLIFLTTPFIFGFGLIIGVIIDRSADIDKIQSIMTSMVTILGFFVALGTLRIAWRAEKTWRKKIRLEQQHNAMVEMRVCLGAWLASFEDIYDWRSGLTVEPYPKTPGLKRDLFETLAKGARKERTLWTKLSRASLKLSCNRFKEHLDSLKKTKENRDFVAVAVKDYIDIDTKLNLSRKKSALRLDESEYRDVNSSTCC